MTTIYVIGLPSPKPIMYFRRKSDELNLLNEKSTIENEIQIILHVYIQ
jgi:hypothetical protein